MHAISQCFAPLKALSHDAIFLATSNVILLLRDVKLANTRLHSILLGVFLHIKHVTVPDDKQRGGSACCAFSSRGAIFYARLRDTRTDTLLFTRTNEGIM